ncbi:MAG: hypothetical protein IPK81_14125 [Rhodospirillales bacterium]|nr:MAG: hypothetical protein IPK81_14125 [Rhodospirillales bacterium]
MDTGKLFRNVCESLCGTRWIPAIAEAVEVNERTVRRWAAGDHVPQGVWRQLRDLDNERRVLADDQWQLIDALGHTSNDRAEIGERWNILCDQLQIAQDVARTRQIALLRALRECAHRRASIATLEALERADGVARDRVRSVQGAMADFCRANVEPYERAASAGG